MSATPRNMHTVSLIIQDGEQLTFSVQIYFKLSKI